MSGTSPYSYSLNGGVYQSTSHPINQGVGNYTITVKDANNCTVSSTISVITPNSPSFVSVSSIDVDCYNNATGSLTATAIGGTGTINYSIQPGTSNNTSGQFTTLTATSYTIIATDAVGCSTATTIVINQPDSLTLSSSATPILCNGGNSTLTATAGGGTTPYSYAINGGTYQSSNSFTGITQGSYTITVKDANNCTKTTTINITQPSALTLSSSATPILCNGGNSTLTATAGGGTTPIAMLPMEERIKALTVLQALPKAAIP
ncbi:MAG: hypothetical protein R2831_00165 [Chitinophagaceae bacterium]